MRGLCPVLVQRKFPLRQIKSSRCKERCKTRQESVMKSLRKMASFILVSSALAACSPGIYTGGGWAETAGPGDSRVSFGFDVECCEADAAGHFSLNDQGWDIPVEMSGHVMDFGHLGELGEDCEYYALLEYESMNADYPGKGHAVVCFGEESELTTSDVYGDIWVSVQSGPFVGYENFGPVYGNMLTHHCDS